MLSYQVCNMKIQSVIEKIDKDFVLRIEGSDDSVRNKLKNGDLVEVDIKVLSSNSTTKSNNRSLPFSENELLAEANNEHENLVDSLTIVELLGCEKAAEINMPLPKCTHNNIPEVCEICGSASLKHETRPTEYTYKNSSFIINQPAFWCDRCGEAVISAQDNIDTALDIQTHKALIDSLIPPKEIKRIRKSLNLSVDEANNIFSEGDNVFLKYEAGIAAPSRSLCLLLKILDSNNDLLHTLKEKQ